MTNDRDLTVERARPLLGTVVAIRVSGLPPGDAHHAIDVGFATIDAIQREMSFHDPASDISRLNRTAHLQPVKVGRDTFEVLRRAREISSASAGAFDLSIAGLLVAWGILPPPDSPAVPAARTSWRDIELCDDSRVRFSKPLWIDVGGIAKGYAVDRALDAMDLPSDAQCTVNAGGDLGTRGPRNESILLQVDAGGTSQPVVLLRNGCVASSSGSGLHRVVARRRVGPHVNGLTRAVMGLRSFVSVVAKECVVADALTKVVMVRGEKSVGVLRKFEATAHVCRRGVWRTIG